MTTPYDDIIHLPHPEPDPYRHPRMSALARAAQFAPFAALTGYEDAIAEAYQNYEQALPPDFYPDLLPELVSPQDD